jgi:hypothetical protein
MTPKISTIPLWLWSQKQTDRPQRKQIMERFHIDKRSKLGRSLNHKTLGQINACADDSARRLILGIDEDGRRG